MSFPTNPYERPQANMSYGGLISIHGLGYETIFCHLDSPPVDNLDNFLGYCQAWVKLDFSAELEQHVAVAGGPHDIIAYIDVSRSSPAEFEGGRLMEMLEALHDPLVFTVDELAQVERDMIGYFAWHSEKYITLPFMRSHTPAELKDVWLSTGR
ncbi:hypothetical protein DFH07DRAFT_779051 [Mycena maculata]|uniref:Uncharacterized protein n=1 Tax=Mycena maculata TaxID=230809 RepID=A0AAD7MY87_9AGAR|nr:hypothetical protein DFH07DRAFT_779051 [Mycena maculata]